MKRLYIDIFVIGFALFSMFFGAGNVIFPPYLGLSCGSQWFLGFVCYYLADIGLALVALFAVLRHGSWEAVSRPIGRIPSTLLMSAIMLCIGPMLAIPRTAATTHEMALTPLIPNVHPLLFSAVFFLIILVLCLNESAVVDIVGKILTPALLLGLLLLIAVGIVNPIGPIPNHVLVENVPITGIEAGYQTMDVLAALVFGIILLKSAHNKGYTDTRSKARVVAGAGVVAGAALMVVYWGLTYLGVTASVLFDLSVSRTFLVAEIVRQLLGLPGTCVFSIVVALACITTAIALVSTAAAYFSALSKGRLSYRLLVFLICTFSAVVSNIGLDQIVSISAPVLSVVYPPALTLILFSFFNRRIQSNWVYRMAVLVALIISLMTAALEYGVPVSFVNTLPLASLGLNWVFPALAGGLLGALIGKFTPSHT